MFFSVFDVLSNVDVDESSQDEKECEKCEALEVELELCQKNSQKELEELCSKWKKLKKR